MPRQVPDMEASAARLQVQLRALGASAQSGKRRGGRCGGSKNSPREPSLGLEVGYIIFPDVFLAPDDDE